MVGINKSFDVLFFSIQNQAYIKAWPVTHARTILFLCAINVESTPKDFDAPLIPYCKYYYIALKYAPLLLYKVTKETLTLADFKKIIIIYLGRFYRGGAKFRCINLILIFWN